MIGPHVGCRGDPVGHVEESGDGGDVEDVPVGKSCVAQALAVGIQNFRGPFR